MKKKYKEYAYSPANLGNKTWLIWLKTLVWLLIIIFPSLLPQPQEVINTLTLVFVILKHVYNTDVCRMNNSVFLSYILERGYCRKYLVPY